MALAFQKTVSEERAEITRSTALTDTMHSLMRHIAVVAAFVFIAAAIAIL